MAPESKTGSIQRSSSVCWNPRTSIQSIFDYLESGYTVEEFLEGFPGVSHDQVMTLLKMLKEDLCGKDLRLDSETVDENPLR